MTALAFAGFDPGVTNPAVACVRRTATGYELLAAKTARTKPSDPLELRLRVIWELVSSLIRSFQPAVLGIERQAGAQVGAWRNQEFNADNSKTLWTCGVALGAALAYGAEPRILDPKTAKIAVLGKGYGNADKKTVQAWCEAITGAKLSQAAADAVALAIAASQRETANGVHARASERR